MILRPSHDEYVTFVETEFLFLEQQHGFTKKWDKDDAFRVVYTNPHVCVHIWGWGYGESGHASIYLDKEQLPHWEYVTPFTKKLTEPTGKQQLDDLREHAYRLKHECRDILNGDLSALLPYRPFPDAEKLWQERAYAQIIEKLQTAQVPLSDKWKNRYEHALKNVRP